MALRLWASTFAGRMTTQAITVQLLPFPIHNSKRNAFTSQRRIRYTSRPKPKRIVKDETVYILPSQLYQNEIDSDIFNARADDLPHFNMNNPFHREQKKCILCTHNITPDYKNVKLLSQFVSPHTGEIYGRHITGLCKVQQERVVSEIIKSRSSGMMAYYLKQVEFLKDPKICDPLRPTRPHPY